MWGELSREEQVPRAAAVQGKRVCMYQGRYPRLGGRIAGMRPQAACKRHALAFILLARLPKSCLGF